jgi:hypothetical protein
MAISGEPGLEVGELPGGGDEGAVTMDISGEPGQEVGEPPGGGTGGVSLLNGNEPGQNAGEPPVTWPSPKDSKAASALRSCLKKAKKRRKKGGDAANSMCPSRINFHQRSLSKNTPFGFASSLLRVAGALYTRG